MARTKSPSKPDLTDQIKNRDRKKKKEKPLSFIPLPSTELNCACTDRLESGLSIGRMINLIGDSSSGKSFVALSIFAEMNMKRKFDDYRFIYDDVENANEFDMSYLFGDKVAERIEAPYYKDDDEGERQPVPSNTIEDFHCNIWDAFDMGSPFIYILDSFDALDSEQDEKKVEEMRKARIKGIESKGTYGLSIPRKASSLFRNITRHLKTTESVLIVISQTRENINPISFQKKTRSGGKALKFYSFHEIWLATEKSITKTINAKKRQIGINVLAKVTKNKVTGKIRQAQFPIYYDYGVDDIRSCIRFLLKEGIWKKSSQTINAQEFNVKLTEEKLIEYIEDNRFERKLRNIVGKVWNEIEEKLKLNRKSKYR